MRHFLYCRPDVSIFEDVPKGVLYFTGGPKATCIGCAGFAAFSVAIEKFFDRHT